MYTSTNSLLCQYNNSNINPFECYTFLAHKINLVFNYLGNNEMILGMSNNASPKNPALIRFDYGSGTIMNQTNLAVDSVSNDELKGLSMCDLDDDTTYLYCSLVPIYAGEVIFPKFDLNMDLIGTIKTIDTGCGYVRNVKYINGIYVSSVYCTPNFIISVLDTSANTYNLYKVDSSVSFFNIEFEPEHDRIIFIGIDVNIDYMTIIPMSNLAHSETVSEDTTHSVGTATGYSFTKAINVSLSSSTPSTLSESPIVPSFTSVTLNTPTSGTAIYNTETYSTSILANVVMTLDLDLTCNFEDTVIITISQYLSETIPPWAIYEPATGILNIDTTGVPDDGTTYRFYMKQNLYAKNHYKLIEITVEGCNFNQCIQCSDDVTKCEQCQTGLQWDSGSNKCAGNTEDDEKANTKLVMTTLGVVLAIAIASVLASMSKLGSPQSLWMTVNQIQMITLLFLTGTDIPNRIVDFVQSLDYVLFSFQILDLRKLLFLKPVIDPFDSELDNSLLGYFDIDSGSTLVNNLSFIVMILIVILMHMVVILNLCLFKNKCKRECCLKYIPKLKTFFAYTIYIRIWLEAFLYLMLSPVQEVYKHDYEGLEHTISLATAALFLLLSIGFITLCMVFWIKVVNGYETIRLNEFYKDLKETKFGKAYNLIFMIRRLSLITVLICLQSVDPIFIILTIMGLEMCYLVLYSCIVRPFALKTDNITEILNESIILILIFQLLYNDLYDWTEFRKDLYIYTIATNCFMILTISLLNLTYICIKICMKSKTSTSRTTRYEVQVAPKDSSLASNIKNSKLGKENSSVNFVSQANFEDVKEEKNVGSKFKRSQKEILEFENRIKKSKNSRKSIFKDITDYGSNPTTGIQGLESEKAIPPRMQFHR